MLLDWIFNHVYHWAYVDMDRIVDWLYKVFFRVRHCLYLERTHLNRVKTRDWTPPVLNNNLNIFILKSCCKSLHSWNGKWCYLLLSVYWYLCVICTFNVFLHFVIYLLIQWLPVVLTPVEMVEAAMNQLHWPLTVSV